MSNAQAFAIKFTSRQRRKHINVKEMIAILHALCLWRPRLATCDINLHCDNFAVVQGIIKSSIRGKAMEPLREVMMQIALHNITLKAIWIPTKNNFLADLLSRRKLETIANIYPLLQISLAHENPPHHGMRRSL